MDLGPVGPERISLVTGPRLRRPTNVLAHLPYWQKAQGMALPMPWQ